MSFRRFVIPCGTALARGLWPQEMTAGKTGCFRAIRTVKQCLGTPGPLQRRGPPVPGLFLPAAGCFKEKDDLYRASRCCASVRMMAGCENNKFNRNEAELWSALKRNCRAGYGRWHAGWLCDNQRAGSSRISQPLRLHEEIRGV
jgi:hypothetical protein